MVAPLRNTRNSHLSHPRRPLRRPLSNPCFARAKPMENMDYLWSPWRYRYVSQAGKTEGCPFCLDFPPDAVKDRERLVLHRGQHSFVLLNLYPYTTGHLLITPYAHIANLDEL